MAVVYEERDLTEEEEQSSLSSDEDDAGILDFTNAPFQ